MIWHPLPISVLVSDAMGALMILSAAPTCMSVMVSWNPESSGSGQISLEQRTESSSLHARLGLWLLAFSSALMVAGIADILPGLVPGAMCGTGVLQAMGGKGERAIAFRLIGLGILFAWRVIDRLNRQHPRAPLTVTAGRALLLAVPFILLGWVDTLGAFLQLDVVRPVDCCASVYSRLASVSDATRTLGLPDPAWAWLLGLLTLALVVAAARCVRGQRDPGDWGAGCVAAASLVWAPVAAVTLVRVLAAYHYQVLHHYCPWCLFLPDHRFIGFLLFGAVALALCEGAIAFMTADISLKVASVRDAAARRSAAACRRVLLAVALFTAAAWLPALVWRLRFGAWLG